MKLLLVAATKDEVLGVFKHFKLHGDGFIATEKFDLLITGVGMTATAFALGKCLSKDYDLVLNIGIAGSFDENISLGSLVQITTDTFSELGAEDKSEFISIDDLGFGKSNYQSNYPISGLPKVAGITVNRVHGNAESIAIIKERLHPKTESMEGAAVFYACQMSDTKSLQIRAISNYVAPRAREDWQIGLAIKNLNDWAIDFIKKYTASS